MIFTEEQSNNIYDKLHNWLAAHTPGGRCSKGLLNHYDKNVWKPVKETIDRLSDKLDLCEEEMDFLRMTIYNGPIFRIQNYHSRAKGCIYESGFYQAWSSNINGVANVSNYSNEVLLIVGNAVNGINIFGLLCYLIKYNKITKIEFGKNPENLLMYKKEQEIEYPVLSEYIKKIVTVDKANIEEWENNIIEIIPKDKWKRKNIN